MTGQRVQADGASPWRRVERFLPWRWVKRLGLILFLTAVGRVLGFLFPVIVLRELGQPQASLIYFYINSAYFVAQPVSGGVAQAMVRPIVASATRAESIAWCRAAFQPLVLGAIVAAAIGAVECATAAAAVLPMCFMLVGISFDAFYFQLLSARRRYVPATTYRLLANLGQLACLVGVLAGGVREPLVIIAIFSFSYAIGFAVVEPRERVLWELFVSSVRSTGAQRRALSRAAVPTAISGLAYAGITGLDTYLVRLNAPELVATYGAAKTLAAPLLLVSLALVPVVQPETAGASAVRAAAIRTRLLGSVVVGALAVALGAVLVAGPVVKLVYGMRYPHAGATLVWLAMGATLLGFHSLLQAWCWGRGMYRLPMISLGLGAVVAVATNVSLVPTLGAPGAGIAFLAGAGTAMLVLAVISQRRLYSS